MRHRLPLCLLLVVGAASPPPARAAWPYQPTVNLPVCTVAGNQWYPVIASDGAAGAIVAWQDYRGGVYSDLYIQHVLASGVADPVWPADGRAVSTTAGNQGDPAIVSSGSGGAILAWWDVSSGDVFAQHVLATGTLDPGWPAEGRVLCNVGNAEPLPAIVSDGAGGAIVAESQGFPSNIYAQRVLASGALDPGWPLGGRALCTAADDQTGVAVVPDGGGGAIVAWQDHRSGSNWDVYAQHVLASGAVDPGWPLNGRALCAAPGDQTDASILSDGTGGAIVSWSDLRSGSSSDIYAQHVPVSGAVDPAWPLNGRALCTAAGDQSDAATVSDGAGGAIVAWQDSRSGSNWDVYAHRVLASGAVDPAWPLNGRALCAAAGDQSEATIVSDGGGGAIVIWHDSRNPSDTDIYSQRVLPSGAVDPAWPADGRALCTASNHQFSPVAVPDGAGAAIVIWFDARNANNDIYAQRVEGFGRLGNPEPAILSVRDVPNDQGGKLRIRWRASYLDTLPSLEVSVYGIWQRVTESAALTAVRRGAVIRTADNPVEKIEPGTFMRTTSATQAIYWEGLGTVAARGDSVYSFLAITLQDSTGSANPWAVYRVDAHGAFLPGFWESTPDSGYSVDNLAPAAPAPFTGTYAAGTAALHWNPNSETDLAGYRLYQGSSPDFVPGPGSLVAVLSDTGFVHSAGQPYYYKLTATDIHENASPSALLLPGGALDVKSEATVDLAIAPPQPNPARGATILRFALPREMQATLAVYDPAGRRVRVLRDALFPAGEHIAVWNLRDGAGRLLGAGLYFARLEVPGRTLTRRIVALR